MEKKRRVKLYKMFSKWSLSYIAISLLAIIIIGICTVRFTRELQADLEYANAVQLEMTQVQMDNSISGLRSFCNYACLNKTVIALEQERNYDTVSRYQLYALVKELASEKLTGNWSDNCFLYFPVLDLLITEHTYNESKDFYDIYLNSYDFNYESLYEAMSKESPATRILPLEGEGDSTLVAVVKSVNSSRKHPAVNAVVILDLKELLHSSKWLDAERDQICIIDRINKKVVSNAAITPQQEEYLLNMSLEERNEAVSNQKKVEGSVISFISSEYENWDYVVITQEQESAKNLVELQRLVIILILIYLLISAVIIGNAAFHHYQPLKNVLNALEEQGAEVEDEDAYEYISKSVHQLIKRNKENSNVINKQKNAISKEMFHRLLTEKDFCRITDEALLGQYGINVAGNYCYVLAYRLDKEAESATNKKIPEEIAQFIIQNVTEENVHTHGLECICFPEGVCEQVFLIWGEQISEDEMRTAIRDICMKAGDFVTQYFKVPYHMALSELHRGIEEVCGAYAEVLRVFDYQKKENDERIMAYGQINLLPVDTLLKFPIDVENQLTHSVSRGNLDEACKQIRFLLEENQINCLAPEAMQFLVSNIAASIIKVVVKVTKDDSISLSQKKLMEACTSLDTDKMQQELFELAANACQQIAEFAQRDKEDQKARLYLEVKEYIEKNYNDVELSVNYIAEHFEIQPTYLSKLFKEMEGENVSVYIHLTRLEHVKELLKEDVRLEEIVTRCGFGSQRTFLRVFKQYEGVTPTQYKELLEKKRNEE